MITPLSSAVAKKEVDRTVEIYLLYNIYIYKYNCRCGVATHLIYININNLYIYESFGNCVGRVLTIKIDCWCSCWLLVHPLKISGRMGIGLIFATLKLAHHSHSHSHLHGNEPVSLWPPGLHEEVANPLTLWLLCLVLVERNPWPFKSNHYLGVTFTGSGDQNLLI